MTDAIADDAYAAAAAAMETADRELAVAMVALGETEQAIARAKARLGDHTDPDPAGALAELDEATARRTRQQHLAKVLEGRTAARRADAARAWAERARPDLDRGVARRIAACRKAEKARAVLAEAEAEHAAATEVVQAAYLRGLPRTFDGGQLFGPLKPEAEERALWGIAA